MRISSKILILILLLFSVNSFSKTKSKAKTKVKLFSKSVEELVKNLNIAYEKRDGSAFYDLLANNCAYNLRSNSIMLMLRTRNYLTRYLNSHPNDNKALKRCKMIVRLIGMKKRVFFDNLFKYIVYLGANRLAAKINIVLVSKEDNGIFVRLRLSRNNSKSITIMAWQKKGNWKIAMAEGLLNFLFDDYIGYYFIN